MLTAPRACFAAQRSAPSLRFLRGCATVCVAPGARLWRRSKACTHETQAVHNPRMRSARNCVRFDSVAEPPLQPKRSRVLAHSRRRLARVVSLVGLLAQLSLASADESTPTVPAAKAFSPALTYDGSVLSDLRGGAQTGTTYLGNLHLKLTVEGDALGLSGTSAYVDLLNIHGGHPVNLVGDAQGTNNTAGPNGSEIEELWVQHNFKSGSASVLLGIYDLNSEFYRLKSAAVFLNSAFGIGPEFAQSGVEGPSIFPRTSAGLRFGLKPTSDTVVRAAVLDGVPVARPDGSHAVFRAGDGVLTVIEFAALARADDAHDSAPRSPYRIGRFSSLVPYDDKFAVGAWHYTGSFQDLRDTDATGSPLLRRGSSGAYMVGERALSGQDGASGRRFAAYMQAGIADPRVNRFQSYVGAGIVGSGWGSMKDSDRFGASIARSTNGNHYLRARAEDGTGANRAETTVELTYLKQISKSLFVQPDVQYVIHPNTDPMIANALVLQLHFEVSF
jgi:porin